MQRVATKESEDGEPKHLLALHGLHRDGVLLCLNSADGTHKAVEQDRNADLSRRGVRERQELQARAILLSRN